MSFIKDIKSNWSAIMAIVAIMASSLLGWNYAMAQVKSVAADTVDARVNKAIIDSAERAASEAAAKAVNEMMEKRMPEVAEMAAKKTVEILNSQGKLNSNVVVVKEVQVPVVPPKTPKTVPPPDAVKKPETDKKE